LDTHIEALSAQLSDTDPTEALKVTASLEASLQTQKEDIQKITQEGSGDEQTDALKAVDSTIKKVSDQEVKIISKEIDQLGADIQNVPDSTIENPDETPDPVVLPKTPTLLPVKQ
jgi:cytochrome c556